MPGAMMKIHARLLWKHQSVSRADEEATFVMISCYVLSAAGSSRTMRSSRPTRIRIGSIPAIAPAGLVDSRGMI
jgi:hypothetical protein